MGCGSMNQLDQGGDAAEDGEHLKADGAEHPTHQVGLTGRHACLKAEPCLLELLLEAEAQPLDPLVEAQARLLDPAVEPQASFLEPLLEAETGLAELLLQAEPRLLEAGAQPQLDLAQVASGRDALRDGLGDRLG